MAITQAGTTLQFTTSDANAGTVTTTMTVPAGAEIAVVSWSGFSATAGFFSSGSMTLTKGGVDTAMTFAGLSSDGPAGLWQTVMFYLALPDVGANKTLKWDWAGAGNAGDASALCSVTFWNGVDTASPVRGAGSGSGSNTPYTSSSVTALTGDLIVAAIGAFCPGIEGTIDSWSNLTTLTQLAHNSSADGAWATGSPSGNTVVAASTDTGLDDGGIVAISLKPATAGGTILLGDYALDNGLAALDTDCDKVFVCGASPTSYSDATSGANSLGSKNWGAGAAFGSPAARSGGGRQITSTAITDGSISTAGTVAYWAAVDSANSRLLASGSLSGGKAVTVGQVFTLGAMTFGIPNT